MLKTFVGGPSWVPASNACPSWVSTSAWQITSVRCSSIAPNSQMITVIILKETVKRLIGEMP